jgi:hypothetical protein
MSPEAGRETPLPSKAMLRDAVAFIYGEKSEVVLLSRRGIIPGSLLGAGDRAIAVRVAPDREFSLTRRRDGGVATIPDVQEVAVAAPCRDQSESVEVFAFSPKLIIEEFKRAVTAQRALYPKVSKGPVFVPLDTPQADGTPLTEKALWREVVPIDRLPPHSPDNSLQEFRQRVHREFARLTGLSEAEVEVEFRIVPLHRKIGRRERR